MKILSYAVIYLCCSLMMNACASSSSRANANKSSSNAVVNTVHAQPVIDHPDATPFTPGVNAKTDVALALSRAKSSGKFGLVVMGANWCHDSRALAGHFQTERFASLLSDNYEVVYVDVGQKDENLDIASSFGVDDHSGTPIVIVTAPNGKALNLSDATRWRNAASRSGDDIYAYFLEYTGES